MILLSKVTESTADPIYPKCVNLTLLGGPPTHILQGRERVAHQLVPSLLVGGLLQVTLTWGIDVTLTMLTRRVFLYRLVPRTS